MEKEDLNKDKVAALTDDEKRKKFLKDKETKEGQDKKEDKEILKVMRTE